MGIIDNLDRHGERPALMFPGGRTISYGELGARVALLAAELGATKRLIAVEAERSEHAVIAYLAALKGGHAVALLPSGCLEAIDAFEQDFAPDIVFRNVDGRWRRMEAGQAALRGSVHDDLAVLLATSGSTGKARYVRLSRQAIEANARSIAAYLGLTVEDRGALILPFHYSYGLSVLNSHLAAGGCVYVAARSAADAGFAAELREAGCTNISGVPYSYELMEKTGFLRESLPALRFMTAAGGRMPAPLAEAFRHHLAAQGKRFFLMYGQTEATARIAYVPPESLAGNVDAIGIAIPGGELRLVDTDGRQIDRCGDAGELVYRGPNVMMGYADCRADLARGAELTELRTGDIATRDEHGFYRLVGRAKRMSKIAGLRISHEAVEHKLAAQGIVAAVMGDDRCLTAAVASDHEAGSVLEAMMKASGLSPLQLDIRPVPALPRLASGKIDYAKLRELAPPRKAGLTGDIVDAFRQAFYPKPVGRADSFETLGGDLLIYVQLYLTVERALGQAPEGWEKMPVGELASLARVEGAGRTIDTELLIRAAAIVLIVIHHATLWPIPGGAATLMMLVGYGLARFQSAALFAGDTVRLLKSLAGNLAVYAPIVLGFCLARGEVLWPSVFLVGNLGFTGPDKMLPYLYWFVEAYAQIVLLCAALFSIAPLRRAVSARPFLCGLVALAATVALKLTIHLVWNMGALQIFTVPDVLYLAVFGWCVHFAGTRRQRFIVLAAALLVLPYMAYWGGNWTGSWVKYLLVAASVALLIFRPRVEVPALAARLVLPVAAASYHIYLFHRLLPELLLPQPDVQLWHPLAAAIAVVGGILVGLGVYAVQRRLTGYLAERRMAGQAVLAPAE